MRALFRSRLYLGAAIALFVSGLGASAAVPEMSRFLTEDLHAPLPVAGLYLPHEPHLARRRLPHRPVVGSDRNAAHRIPSLRDARLGRLLLMAAANQAWMPFVISALVLAVGGVAGSQLFAAIHDEIEADRVPGGDGVISSIRMMLTAGWIVGPVLGTFLASWVGVRWMLVWTAACALLQLVPMWTMKVDATTGVVRLRAETAGRARPTLRAMTPLLVFTLLYVLSFSGDPSRYAYLPIVMQDHLGASPVVIGAAIGLQPAVELCLMPFTVLLARRVGALPLMAVGAALGALAYACFALSGALWGAFVGQALIGVTWSVFAALGIIVAQRLLPGAIATASGVFMTAPAFTSAIGGFVGAIGVSTLGLPTVFLIPAAVGAVATVGLVAFGRTRLAAPLRLRSGQVARG